MAQGCRPSGPHWSERQLRAAVVGTRFARPADYRDRVAIDAVREEALALSESERGRLAADLLASLQPPVPADEPTTHEAWLEELAQRAERALSGEEPGELWSDVEVQLRNELTG